MHIGIWYTPALRQRAGIGRYTRGIVSALAKLDSPHQYTLVVSNDSPLENLPSFPKNFTVKVLPLSERWLTILWHRANLPLWIDRWAGRFDLFHSPDFVLPPLASAPGLLTVHDLSFMKHPDGALPKLRDWLLKVVPKSVARAAHVLADSESTGRDLQELLHVPAKKISVVGAGVEPRFHPITNEAMLASVRQKYRLPENFVLGVGTLEPRKNFTGLIAAFDKIAADAPDLHLVIAGGKGWLYEPIFAAAEASSASERIHLIGFVADEDLPALYSMARVFAYPSFYEGFGIPILEAMACGTPVITADNSSLPEVGGDPVLLVDADDIDTLAQTILLVHTTDHFQTRCVPKGIERAAQFTWERAAQKLLAVYDNFSAA